MIEESVKIVEAFIKDNEYRIYYPMVLIYKRDMIYDFDQFAEIFSNHYKVYYSWTFKKSKSILKEYAKFAIKKDLDIQITGGYMDIDPCYTKRYELRVIKKWADPETFNIIKERALIRIKKVPEKDRYFSCR